MAIDPNDPNAPAFGGQSALGWLFSQFSQWLQTPQGQAAATQAQQQQPAPAKPPLNEFGTAGEPSVSGQATGGQPAQDTSTQQQRQALNSNDPNLISQALNTANDQFIAANEQVNQLTRERDQLVSQYNELAKDPTGNFLQLQQIQSRLTPLETNLASATTRLAGASTNLATMQINAANKLALEPAQVADLKQKANQENNQAYLLGVQAQTLLDAAPLQRGQLAAQIGLTTAQALQANAQAKG